MTHEDRLAALESPRRIYVLAGEASGDAHAAHYRRASALADDAASLAEKLMREIDDI